jgi:hypothetical protein
LESTTTATGLESTTTATGLEPTTTNPSVEPSPPYNALSSANHSLWCDVSWMWHRARSILAVLPNLWNPKRSPVITTGAKTAPCREHGCHQTRDSLL